MALLWQLARAADIANLVTKATDKSYQYSCRLQLLLWGVQYEILQHVVGVRLDLEVRVSAELGILNLALLLHLVRDVLLMMKGSNNTGNKTTRADRICHCWDIVDLEKLPYRFLYVVLGKVR